MNEIVSAFETVSVADQTMMRIFVSRPKEADAKKGLLLFQEAFGVNPYIRSVAERFAREGFTVVAPELFHRTAGDGFEASYTNAEVYRPHLLAVTMSGLEADIQAAYTQMKAMGVPEDAISSIGFCMGGRASFVANSILPLKSAISFYGGGISALLDRVPAVYGPMLFFWGGLDQHISVQHRGDVIRALQEAGKSYADVLFSDADHGFFCDARASYHARSSELAWPLVLEFLK